MKTLEYPVAWWRAYSAFSGYRRLLRANSASRPQSGGQRGQALALVFVPGWASNAGVGRPLLAELAAELSPLESTAWHCPWPTDSLLHSEKVQMLRAVLLRAEAAGAEHIALIAHSYGGLVAATTLLDYAPKSALTTEIITLNTPFRGPRKGLLFLGQLLTRLRRGLSNDPELDFMSPDSEALRALRERLTSSSRGFRLRTLTSAHDEFVAHASGQLAGAELAADGLQSLQGHTGLLVRPRERKILVKALAAALRDDHHYDSQSQ
ncbi:MAG: hypothetical protein V3W41_03330 [Planctomycetota bacterium]